ncbi:MAG: type I methionyl aminopeptidase [Candidatus Gygaella obscura]|nr:type I methionyl aminopeptidase [Candidatus Gygaella obscura]
MIIIKTPQELQIQREVCKILAEIFKAVTGKIKPGITTLEIEKITEALIFERNMKPAFKGYQGYPACSCISVNEEVVHGIPSDRVIKEGDIVSVDMGIEDRGFFADMARTIAMNPVDTKRAKLIDVAKKALEKGIAQAKEGNFLQDISYTIQNFVESNGFSVVREYVGHGIGRKLHEEPEIPNFGIKGLGVELKKGMVLAIEPMVNAGTWQTKVLNNGWTAVTADGKISAHFENTIAVTDQGPEILTNY